VHLAASLLAWRLVRCAFREARHPRAEPLALATAGLFALHPIQSEAVAYLVQRGEALASALAIGGLLLFLRTEQLWGSRDRWLAWGAACATFFAAVAAKPLALATPAAYLTYRVFIISDARPHLWRRAIAIVAPLLVAAAILSLILLHSLRDSPDAGLNAGDLGPWRYLLTQTRVTLSYVRLLAWPIGQTIEHVISPSPGFFHGPTLAAVFAITGLACVPFILRAYVVRHPAAPSAPAAQTAAFGIAWFFVWLAPTSSVIPLADPMFEHRVYLASLGIFAAAIAAADLVLSLFRETLRRSVAIVAVTAVWLALGALTWARANVWSRQETLWTEAVMRAPASARAYWNLGHALNGRGDLEGALEAFRRSERLQPSAPWRSLLQENIGNVLRRLGRPVEARQAIDRALERDPSNGSLHDDLAILLLEAGDLEAAEVHARKAVQLAPGHAPYWETLGDVSRKRGDSAMQLIAMRRAASLDPKFPERDAELALLEDRLGNVPKACEAWSRVIRWTEEKSLLRARANEHWSSLGCANFAAGLERVGRP